MIYDELRHEGAFSRCFDCDCVIRNRDDARWIDSKNGKYLACTECAGGHDPDIVSKVERHPLLENVANAEAGIEEGKRIVKENVRRKYTAIHEILDEEGYRKGMTFYGIGGEKMIITGRTKGLNSQGEVHVLAHKAKKDGTPQKYGEQKISWIDFIRLWRMQRVDKELYLRRTEERWEKKNEELRNRKLNGDIKF